MGRYYSGDIEGKFMFAVQSSDAASRFGGQELEPNYIEYWFGADEHYEDVVNALNWIEEKYGKYLALIDEFFEDRDTYNDKMLEDFFESKGEKFEKLYLSEYADRRLGRQIKQCLEENGECNFKAEL